LLQLAGVVTVLLSLRDRGLLFQAPGVRRYALGWLHRFPKFFVSGIASPLGTAEERDSAASLNVVVWRSRDPNAPLQDQIGALSENIETVRAEVSRVTAETARRVASLHTDITSERAARLAETSTLTSTVKQAAVGSLGLERVGAVWLLVGITLATIPAELVGACAR
jgi:hypothetical protein